MKKIRKVIIPVAGMGTRFLPITKSIPKPMLPIIDKPTIQYIVEEAVESGIEEIIFITSGDRTVIEDYFEISPELENKFTITGKIEELKTIKDIPKLAKFHYIKQVEPLGTGHAIALARPLIGNEPFAVMYGDDLMYYKGKKPVLKQLIEIYEKYDCNVIGVQDVDPSSVSKYGIVKYSDEKTGKIDSIIEKPSIGEAPSDSAGLGRYIVKPEVFDMIGSLKVAVGSEVQFTDALAKLMEEQYFYACKFEGKYCDIGNKLGYLEANIKYALDREDLKDELLEVIKKLIV